MMMLNLRDASSPLDALESKDCLISLNRMMDTFSGMAGMIFQSGLDEFSLTAGKQTYTLGTGGDFNLPRPAYITQMSVVSLNNPAQPVEIPIDIYHDAEWQNVPVKNISGPQPYACYDDGSFPFRNLSFFPIPSVNLLTRIYSWSPLSNFPDLQTPVAMPQVYLEAMEYNLAIRIAALFPPAQPSALIVKLAADTISILESANTVVGLLTLDSALGPAPGGHYNWLTDRPAKS